MSADRWFDRLRSSMTSRDSLVCVGIDPDLTRMPAPLPQRVVLQAALIPGTSCSAAAACEHAGPSLPMALPLAWISALASAASPMQQAR